MKSLVSFFDKKAKKRSKWLRRNKYYNKQIISFMRFHIPKQSSVLEIGCGTGFLLNTLSPKKGMGIDFSEKMIEIARRKYPHLNFLQADAHNYQLKEKYDYIIISDTIGYFEDIQAVLKNIKQNCTEKTRIIITSYNFLWEPFLKLSEVLGLKMKQPFTNWLSPKDITGLLELEDYDIVKTGNKILMPKYIPLISHFANVYLTNLPLFKRMSLMKFIVARETPFLI